MKKNSVSQKKMMQFVRETYFAMLEASLYLDTHPYDEKAMDYFNKYQQMYNDALKDYENNCGPLTISGIDTCDGWSWTQEPWPWEGGCN